MDIDDVPEYRYCHYCNQFTAAKRTIKEHEKCGYLCEDCIEAKK
jgi:hypothetical protein